MLLPVIYTTRLLVKCSRIGLQNRNTSEATAHFHFPDRKYIPHSSSLTNGWSRASKGMQLIKVNNTAEFDQACNIIVKLNYN